VTEAQKKERLGIDGFATGKIGIGIRLLGDNFKAFMSALGQKQSEGVNNPIQQTHNSSLTLRLSHTQRSTLLTHGQSMRPACFAPTGPRYQAIQRPIM
jgi:hypothetical protein